MSDKPTITINEAILYMESLALDWKERMDAERDSRVKQYLAGRLNAAYTAIAQMEKVAGFVPWRKVKVNNPPADLRVYRDEEGILVNFTGNYYRVRVNVTGDIILLNHKEFVFI